MRRNSQVITATTATVATIAILAFAMIAAPSFVFAQMRPYFIAASSSLNGPNLVCNFKEAGLGNLGFSNIHETCSATASAVYECVNNGGNPPQAANKETVSGSGFFPISNGQTTD